MNQKTKSITAAALLVGAGGGLTTSYKTGENAGFEAGRETVMSRLYKAPLSGQQIFLNQLEETPEVFALASPDLSAEHFQKLLSACPSNKWVVIAGRAPAK